MTITITLNDEITPADALAARREVGREIGIRKNAYRNWVERGTLRQADADAQMARMNKAYELLKAIEAALPMPGQMSFDLNEEEGL